MSTFEATLEQLPKPILDKLQSIIWRVRRLLVVRGIFATLAIGLLCLLSIMAIDATVTIFSQVIRWSMTLLGLLITVGAGWWYLVRPLSRKISLTHVARILEVRHPELQERISTAVELLSSKDPEEIKGSEELIKAVVDSAVLDVQNISPRREFKGVRAMKFVKLTALRIAALATVLLVFPNHGWKLLARAVAPFLNIGNAYADTMVVSPGNTRIARGRELTVEMQISHDKLRRAELRRILPDGSESVERMTLMGKTEDGAQKFSITFPGVQEDFKYRVRAGIAVSEYYQVEAVPPPVVEKRTIRYDYPDYTGLASREEESTSGEIRAVTHTSVTITSQVNKEVWKAKTILNNADELGETNIEKNIVTTTFPLKNSTNGTWRLDLEDLDEFTNERLPFPIQSLPDKAPAIRITNPTFSQLRLKPVEVLPMEFDLTEDFGFSEVALLVTPNGETSPRIIVQSPPTRDEKSGIWKGNASLNLALLKLEPHHNQLQVQVRARDNRPANFDGPGEGLSETIIILIDQNAKSLAEQTIEAQKKDLTQAIRQVREDLERAKGDIASAERELQKKDEVTPEAERDLERFRQEAKEAEEAIKEVAEKLENSVFKPQTEALQDIAKDEITKAQESADMIPVTDEKKERLKEAAKARDEVAQALNKLQDVEKSIQKSETDLRAIAQLNEMANEQRKLAQEAADRAKEADKLARENVPTNPQQEEQAMNEFQRKQERVQQNLGELLKDNAAALKEILEKQKEQAESLADEAKQLAKEQKDLKNLADASKAKPDSQQKAELQEQIMNQLQEQQKQIAQETAEVQKELAAAEKSQAAQNAEQKATPQAKTPPALKEAAKQTQAAAESLAKENLEKAGESAKEAAEALAEAAQEAAAPQPKPNAPEQSKPAAGEQAAEMAKTPQAQNPADAAQQAPTTAESPKPAAGEKATEMAQNQQPQNPAEAAQKAASNPQTPGSDAPKPAAGEPGSEMAQNQQPQNPADAAQQPAVGESGVEMADTPPPPNPAMEAAADALSELAERQEAIAEQIESVKAGNLQEALAQMEEQLAAQSEGLEDQAQSLSKALENLKQNQSRYEANHAANFLQSAANQAQQASQSFDQAQQAQSQAESQGAVPPGQTAPQAQQAMARAQQNQQQAERSMETAASSLEKASDAISKSLKGLKPSEKDERLADSEQMAESFEDLSQSAQSENAGEAAQNSQQAAQSLQELAQQAMKQLGNMGEGQQEPGQPNQQPSQEMAEGQPKGNQPNEGGKSADASGDGIPPELKDLGITAKDWARFKGALAGGNANAIDTNLPAEYRELVGRYFQVIAKEANGK